MAFDPRLPCQTRAGRKVEILAVLPPDKITSDGERIVALVDDYDRGRPTIETYTIGGVFNPKRLTTWDLVNVSVPKVTAEQYAAMTQAEGKQFVTQTAARIRAVVEG